jgi:uncharacterized protein YndB with AHSA1/START domain
MSDAEQIKVTRTVDAAPDAVFAVLADPQRHLEIDGSGFMRSIAKGGPIGAVGDEFVVSMNNPVLGDYQVLNRVHAYEPGRTIGWSPSLYPPGGYADKLGDMVTTGHSFTWELAPSGSGTEVTQTYDWSGVADPGFRSLFPLLKEEQLLDSIGKVGEVA